MANSRSFCKRIYYARKSIDVCDVIIVRILYRYYVIFISYQEDRVGAVPGFIRLYFISINKENVV